MNMVWFLGIAGVGMLLIAVVVSRRSRAAAILPGLVGAVLLFIVANFVAADRWLFPDAYDNPEALARLQDANLRNDWPAPASNDCPQWRGSFRDGSAAVPRIARDWTVHPPQQKWRIEASGGDSSPIVAAGRVYLHERHAEGEQIRCVDAETGIGIWSDVISVDYRPIKKPIQGPRATPAIHEGKLYLITARGQLIAYDTTTAKRLWERDLLKEHNASLPPSGMAGSPLIEGDMVIVQPVDYSAPCPRTIASQAKHAGTR